MIAFCSDLDRTLIYSNRVPMDVPRVVAEYYNGKPQSFMTEQTLHFLRELRQPVFFPVTTRTPEQFARIHVFGGEIPYRAALMCNGALLSENGVLDEAWRADSLRFSASSFPEVQRIYTYLQGKYGGTHLHIYEPFFAYFVNENAMAIGEELRRVADLSLVYIHADRRKVYCYPRGLDKGNAVRRLRARFGITKLIASGDSVFDIPMLDAADLAFAPERLRGVVSNGHTAFGDGEMISDALCNFVEQNTAQTPV